MAASTGCIGLARFGGTGVAIIGIAGGIGIPGSVFHSFGD